MYTGKKDAKYIQDAEPYKGKGKGGPGSKQAFLNGDEKGKQPNNNNK